MASRKLDALKKLTQRHSTVINDLKERVWENKSTVFAIIKENESLENELREIADEKEVVATAARQERYLRLAERQQAGVQVSCF